jgi:hypothetical protein
MFLTVDRILQNSRVLKELQSGLTQTETTQLRAHLELKLADMIRYGNPAGLRSVLRQLRAALNVAKPSLDDLEPIVNTIVKEETQRVVALATIMDVYLIARLLRSPPKKPGDKARYAIIYVGQEHAAPIRLLINKLKFNTLRNAAADPSIRPQCIDITNFAFPFFVRSPKTGGVRRN